MTQSLFLATFQNDFSEALGEVAVHWNRDLKYLCTEMGGLFLNK
jgi:hypothetical protein